MKLTKIFTAIAICFPLIAFAQNKYDIQHIRDVYYSVKEDIAFSKEHKFEGRLYCDIAEKNAHGKSWRATGVFHSKTEYWYNDDPSIINGVGENPRTCLDMVIENMEIAARQLYIEYLFEKGQLIFVFYKTDDVEVRLYFKDNRLIKQLGKFENDVPTTKEIMGYAETCMQQFLYSFGVKNNW